MRHGRSGKSRLHEVAGIVSSGQQYPRGRDVSALQTLDTGFKGSPSAENLFARLVRGEIEQWGFWEDSEHIAILTPFGNTPG
ncbi:hypothetical protein LTR66_016700, partial [Elasticomyces elasticus]